MEFEPIFKDRSEINIIAEKFLTDYHPILSIPIPIEEILDNKLGIDIIPFPDLKNSFSRAGLDIDAFISSDFKSISVDEHIYYNAETRFRFSLAHEIGHMYLHQYLYKEFCFNNRDEWKKLIREIPVKKRETLEWQADEFAGLVLVPRKLLGKYFKEDLEFNKKEFKISLEDRREFAIDFLYVL